MNYSPSTQIKVLSPEMIAYLVGFSHFTVRTVPGNTGNSGDMSNNPGNSVVLKLLHSEIYD